MKAGGVACTHRPGMQQQERENWGIQYVEPGPRLWAKNWRIGLAPLQGAVLANARLGERVGPF